MNQLININLNRFKEATRVLEDIARFELCDEVLFLRLKVIKHSVNAFYSPGSVSSQADVVECSSAGRHYSLFALFEANIHRMQETARVLEEVCAEDFFKRLRFECYDLQCCMHEKLKVHVSLRHLKGIYPICDFNRTSIEETVVLIKKAKVNLCQVRMKEATKRNVYQCVVKFKKLLQDASVFVLVNDHVDVAMACADGVHIGQDDLPLCQVRTLVGSAFIVGVSCHNVSEAVQAERGGASYISVGCLFDSNTKKNTHKTSMNVLDDIVSSVNVPVCAIGGVTNMHVPMLLDQGVEMFAMHEGFFKRARRSKVY